MKKKFINKWFIGLAMVLFLFSCDVKRESNTAASSAHNHVAHMQYTCPMHPQIIRDEPGKCPICGMDLVPMSTSNELHLDSSLSTLLKPVNEQIISSIATINAESGSRIFNMNVQGVVAYDARDQQSISSRVGGRIERMYIKYNYQPVRKGQLIMEIYSPDIVAAQRELIYLSKSADDAGLIQKARQRLLLLGMQPAQINQIVNSGKPYYRLPVFSNVSGYIVEKNKGGALSVEESNALPSVEGMGGMNDNSTEVISTPLPSFDATPVMIREGQYVSAGETLFTVYKDNSLVAEFSIDPPRASEIKVGQKMVYYPVADLHDVKTGVIGLIEPTQRNGRTFSVARMYLSQSNLRPGQLLSAKIPVVLNHTFCLPEKSVWLLGTKAVVFKKVNGVFIPEQVQTGLKTEGLIEIKSQIGDWEIAANASFLVDNESFIRTTSKNQQ